MEYGLLAALLSVAIIGGTSSIGDNIGNLFGKTSNTIENVGK